MQSTSIQQFQSEQFGTIRTTTIDGEPWFVAKDVCDALGIRSDTVRNILDDDEVSETNPNTIGVAGGRKPLIISEAGLYGLVLKSRKPEAKAFKRWVTHEVLPSIRKHGAYITPQTMADMMADPRNIAKVFNALADEQQKNQALTEDNARMLPKAVAYDATMDADGTYTVTQVSRYLNQMGTPMTVKRLYALLKADEMICKVGNAPTKKAIRQGLARQMMSVRPDGKANDPYARITQKGVDWCVNHYATMPAQIKVM